MSNCIRSLCLLMLLFTTTFAGCRSGLVVPPGSAFVGRLDGTDALISVVVLDDANVMAYVCDGLALAEWFRGRFGHSLDFQSNSDARLQLRFTDAGAEGTFTTPQGRPHTFSLARAGAEGWLYRAVAQVDGVKYVGGWILLATGEQRGAVKQGASVVASPLLDLSAPSSVAVPGIGTMDATQVGSTP